MIIRKISENDFKNISKLLYESFDWYLKMDGSEWIKSKFSDEGLRKSSISGISIVAVQDNSIVAYANYSISEYGALYISTIAVDKSVQSKGIGSKLLRYIEEESVALKIHKIWLMVSHINYDAIAFYLKNEFIIEGFLTNMTLKGVHEIIMSKNL